jgi:hypothetical protein
VFDIKMHYVKSRGFIVVGNVNYKLKNEVVKERLDRRNNLSAFELRCLAKDSRVGVHLPPKC